MALFLLELKEGTWGYSNKWLLQIVCRLRQTWPQVWLGSLILPHVESCPGWTYTTAEQSRLGWTLSAAFTGPNEEMGRWAELHIFFPKLANEVICSNFPGKKGVSEGAERGQDPYTNEHLSSCGYGVGQRRLRKPIDIKELALSSTGRKCQRSH